MPPAAMPPLDQAAAQALPARSRSVPILVVNLIEVESVVMPEANHMNHISNSDAAWITFAALLPVVLYLLFSAYQTRERMAVRKAVIDKFSAAEDFAAFLRSP